MGHPVCHCNSNPVKWYSLYNQARVPDPSRLFLEVGLGFFVELTLEEALKVIERKTAALEQKATALTQDACKVGGRY